MREPGEPDGSGASRRVSRGIMQALESGRLAPGQRLVEADLAAQFGVGRNAVRESIQWLAAHGAIEIIRFRSAAIRQLDAAESLDVLDVAESLIALAARGAATRYEADSHRQLLEAAVAELERADDRQAAGSFSRGRRHLYRAMLEIAGNRELTRLFPALGLHIVYAQYPPAGPRALRLDDFHAMAEAIAHNDPQQADAAARVHVHRLRLTIRP